MRVVVIGVAAVLAAALVLQSSRSAEAAEGKRGGAGLKGEHSKKTQTKWFIDDAVGVHKSRGKKAPKATTKCAPVGGSGGGQAC
jgi:hypothetical protein